MDEDGSKWEGSDRRGEERRREDRRREDTGAPGGRERRSGTERRLFDRRAQGSTTGQLLVEVGLDGRRGQVDDRGIQQRNHLG